MSAVKFTKHLARFAFFGRISVDDNTKQIYVFVPEKNVTISIL